MMRLSKKYIVLVLLMVLMAEAIYILPVMLKLREKEHVSGVNLVRLSEPVSEDNTVEMDLTGDGGRMESLSIFFSTYNRVNKGTLHIRLYKGSELEDETAVFLEEIRDNSFFEVKNFHPEMENGQLYRLVLSADNDENSGISVWFDENDNLVCSFHSNEVLAVSKIVNTGAVFLAASYVFCRLIQALRRKT